MATSGTNSFNLDVDQVIEEAFERCGLYSRSGYDIKSARRSLNIMLAEWANRGINLWTVELRTQTLTASTTSYTLGTDLVDVLEAVITEASDANTDIDAAEKANIPFVLIKNSFLNKLTNFDLRLKKFPKFTMAQTLISRIDCHIYNLDEKYIVTCNKSYENYFKERFIDLVNLH